MDSIGKFVKKLREENGMAIEELSELTLIKRDTLIMLESNKVEELGGFGVVKSYANTIVRKLNGSSVKLNNLLDSLYPQYKTNVYQNIEFKNERKFLISMNWLYVILIIAVVIFLSYFSYKTYKESGFNFFKARQEIVEEKEQPEEKIIIELPHPSLRD